VSDCEELSGGLLTGESQTRDDNQRKY